MTADDSQFDSTLDARLRQVRLPEGWSARWKGLAAEPADSHAITPLDSLTADALAMEHPAAGVSASEAGPDSLSALLNDVACPADLLVALRKIPQQLGDASPAAAEESPPAPLRQASWPTYVEQALCEIPLPADLLRSLRRIAEPCPHRWRIREAVAATLMVLLTAISYGGALTIVFAPRGEGGGTYEELIFGLGEPEAIFDPDQPIAEFVASTAEGDWNPTPSLIPLDDSARAGAKPLSGDGDLGQGAFARLSRQAHAMPGVIDGPGPVDPRDRAPELRRRPVSVGSGLRAPQTREFDWRFYLQHGEWPVVWLSQAPRELHTVHIPLRRGADSFRLAMNYLADGDLPPPETIRKEEFLAAGDSSLIARDSDPASARRVPDVRWSAAPSPFGGPEAWLLHVTVRAPDLPPTPHRPTQLVVAIDVSRSMELGSRLSLVREALLTAAVRMGPGDRLTVIAFDDQPQVLAEDLSPRQVEELRRALSDLRADRNGNLAAGVQAAYAVLFPGRKALAKPLPDDTLLPEASPDETPAEEATVAEEPTSASDVRGTAASLGSDSPAVESAVDDPPIHDWPRRVVVICDGGPRLPDAMFASLQRRVSDEWHRNGAQLTVVNLGLRETPGDEQLRLLARQGGGKLVQAGNVAEVQAAVLEALTGASQAVLRHTRFQVTFQPSAVEAYRLIGHEESRSRLPEVADPKATILNLYAGQTASALFEVKLRPAAGVAAVGRGSPSSSGGKDDSAGPGGSAPAANPPKVLATAQLQWLNPQGRSLTHRAPLAASQVALTFGSAPLALQEAALLAELAEVLTHSPYAADSSLADVLKFAQSLPAEVQARPAVSEILQRLPQAPPARRR